jgi:hypothetical protein
LGRRRPTGSPRRRARASSQSVQEHPLRVRRRESRDGRRRPVEDARRRPSAPARGRPACPRSPTTSAEGHVACAQEGRAGDGGAGSL